MFWGSEPSSKKKDHKRETSLSFVSNQTKVQATKTGDRRDDVSGRS